MKLDWAILANHAEAINGLAYITGAGIDTITSPTMPAPFLGAIVLRLSLHPTEIERPHTLEIRFMSEDGNQIVVVNGMIAPILKDSDLPKGWNYHAVFSINIMTQLPNVGHYSVDILADASYLASLPFRVKHVVPPATPPA